jgi:nucleoside-diphosphate-sugar epimerase
MIVRALDLTAYPPVALNLTGQAVLSIRELAQRLAELMDRPVEIIGTEAETALLSNPARAIAALGAPTTSLETILRWTAHWVQRGGNTLNKPTHFEVRDGRY